MNRGKKFIKIALGGVLCLLVLGAAIMLLWNWLVPAIFNVRQIGFLEALGLFLLARILFGGWGGGRFRKGGAYTWKHRYYEKLSSMTPEERERFKKRMNEKWCGPSREKDVPSGGSNV